MTLALWTNAKERFNAMSLRERAMIAAAALTLIVFTWDRAFMNPLRIHEAQLQAEMGASQQAVAALAATIQGQAEDNPIIQAMREKESLTKSLAALDAELDSTSAGLIPPQRMLSTLRDVLQAQHELRLISMRNLPVTSLVPQELSASGAPSGPPLTGPYVHSLELEVEGTYLEVLRYLQKVESLPWRFYWQAFELKSGNYPLNRVRIRLNTLSMEKEWLGV